MAIQRFNQHLHDRRGISAFPISTVIIFGILCFLSDLRLANGQATRPVPNATAEPADNTAAIIQTSEEANTLLARAEEGIQRQDWKLTVDSLQRIIELPGEHLLTSDRQIYESARNYAQRRIASLPPAGLEAYRTIHDGEAAALLNQARDRHDIDLLRTIANKYLLSRYGDDTAVTLADWLVDEDRVSEAAAYLRQVHELYPDSDLPPWVIPARLAVCAAAMGQNRRAHEILGDLRQLPATEPLIQRIKMIQAFIDEGPSASGAAQQKNGWPIAMGGPERRGMMPSVIPAFPRHVIWNVPLPMRDDDLDSERLRQYALSQHLPPTRYAVTDGQTLLINGEADLIALDAASLTVRWSTKGRPTEINPLRMAYMQTTESLRPDVARQLENQPVVWRMLYDHVGAGISLAHGMALTLEWNTDPPAPSSIVGPPAQRPGRVNFVDGVTNMEANRVVAYSIADGQRLWASAGLSDESEATTITAGDVQFLAVPMVVGNLLLVPCRIQTDLYVLLLDPKNGKRVDKIYICGYGGRTFSALSCLEPCLSDGIAFVQTGAGAIAALDTMDWSIRWISRYERKPEGAAGGWLPTPLIGVADVVLAAPTDADQLICFDRMTGRPLWQIPREDFLYLLGATERHAWLVGKQVRMIEVENGRTLWQAEAAEPTGRGALTDERIYLPTTKGLLAYKTDTGDPIALEQPDTARPLGNLLVWDRALYSVSSTEVSKYPDLEQGYAEAVAAHQADPTDVRRAVRLAWLEWSQDRPAEALRVLDGLPETLQQQDERQYRIINQLRVRLLLESATAKGVTPTQARAYLTEAANIAIDAEDRIRTTLALADHERDEGAWSAACQHYLSLVLSPLGDELVGAELDLQRRVRLTAAQHIAELTERLTPAERNALDQQLHAWELKAVEQHDEQALRWLVESTPLNETTCRAALQLGIWMSQDLRNESAEYYYQYVLRHASTSTLAAEATARLARLYLEPDELHLPLTASTLLDKLEHEYTAELLPADILDPAGTELGRQGRKPIGVTQIVAALRAVIDKQILAAHRASAEPLNLSALAQTFAIKNFANACPLVVGGPRPEALTDKMLLLVEGKRLEARQAGDGTLLWPADLKLLGDPAIEPRLEVTQEMFVADRRVYQARGVLEGQTLMVNTSYGLHAVGLLTGRRLWARPFDPPFVAAQSRDPSGYDSWVWASGGYVACVDAQGRLEVAPADRGDAILWRCRRPTRNWYAVRCRGEHVVAVDRFLQTADIFRLADGRYLGECQFHQDRDPRLWTNLSLFDNVICGPVSQHEVAAFEMAVPGIERWRTTMPGPLSQIFKPNADLLAIADRAGFLRIIDPANGRSILQTNVTACRNGVIDGVIIDRVLYVYGYQQREVNPARFENQRWAIAAIDLEDGKTIWQRSDWPAATYLSPEVLSLSTNAIPVVAFIPKSVGQDIVLQELQQQFPKLPLRDYAGLLEVRLVDKANGQDLGSKTLVPMQGRPSSYLPILDVQAWPDQLSIMVGSLRIQLPLKSNNTIQPPS